MGNSSGTRPLAPLQPPSLFCPCLIIAFPLCLCLQVVSGEMFPTSIRGRALGLSTVINWLGNLAVGTTFLSVMEQVGGAGGFAIFGVLSLAGAVYVAACVPETGGRTPEEVVEDMKVSRQ